MHNLWNLRKLIKTLNIAFHALTTLWKHRHVIVYIYAKLIIIIKNIVLNTSTHWILNSVHIYKCTKGMNKNLFDWFWLYLCQNYMYYWWRYNQNKSNISLALWRYEFSFIRSYLFYAEPKHTYPLGSVVAVVGASGSGKSTIGSLLLRLYDPIAGEVTVDGVPITRLDPAWLRALIGSVSQVKFLFLVR